MSREIEELFKSCIKDTKDLAYNILREVPLDPLLLFNTNVDIDKNSFIYSEDWKNVYTAYLNFDYVLYNKTITVYPFTLEEGNLDLVKVFFVSSELKVSCICNVNQVCGVIEYLLKYINKNYEI